MPTFFFFSFLFGKRFVLLWTVSFDLKIMTIYEIMELKEIMEEIAVNATAGVTSFLQVGSGGSFSISNVHMVYSDHQSII